MAASGGLDGIVVADTALSLVDGERGRLVIHGHDVEDIAGRRSFERVAADLLGATGPARDEAATRAALGAGRVSAWARLGTLGDALATSSAMDALRAGLGHGVGAGAGGSEEQAAIAATLPVLAAAWARRRAGQPAIAPSPELGTAQDLLRMLGATPDAARTAALDAYLVTVVDHGLNASTFAARVVASTGSDATSAVVAALGALKGPLHGGAPGPVLDMLDAIEGCVVAGSAATAQRAWLERELATGRRIMGMGHRVYRVRDPRAAVLERTIEALEAAGVGGPRLRLARAVEREAEALLAERHPDRPLRCNVEFYTAVLLEAVGIPRDLFSAVFAVARAIGWLAHVAEQRATGRLIRPDSRYVGPMPGGPAGITPAACPEVRASVA